MINQGGNIYDFAPGIILTREAGGAALNFEGEDWQVGGNQVIMGNRELAKKAANELIL